jgi:predicted nucleotidyltransferase
MPEFSRMVRFMVQLSEKMRRTLERLLNGLQKEANVYGVGLFGSWSRGDAATSSDVDLFILNGKDLACGYVERREVAGLLFDLDFAPRKWFRGQMPPDVDQKLYEMQILYDRDWLLTDSKLSMVKSYGSPERVSIRTEDHLLNSDIYLSRASSALSREDPLSAYAFTIASLDSTLRILAEIAMEPFSNSHFIERMNRAATALQMSETFQEYLEISKLNEITDSGARIKLRLFREAWEEIRVAAGKSLRNATSSHFKVRANLNYYLNPAFLFGVIARTNSLIESGDSVEASHYLNSILLEIAENYLWLRSSSGNAEADYTTPISSLRSLETKNSKDHAHIVDFLSLGNVGKAEATDAIAKARKVELEVRRDRKVLIKNRLARS